MVYGIGFATLHNGKFGTWEIECLWTVPLVYVGYIPVYTMTNHVLYPQAIPGRQPPRCSRAATCHRAAPQAAAHEALARRGRWWCLNPSLTHWKKLKCLGIEGSRPKAFLTLFLKYICNIFVLLGLQRFLFFYMQMFSYTGSRRFFYKSINWYTRNMIGYIPTYGGFDRGDTYEWPDCIAKEGSKLFGFKTILFRWRKMPWAKQRQWKERHVASIFMTAHCLGFQWRLTLRQCMCPSGIKSLKSLLPP